LLPQLLRGFQKPKSHPEIVPSNICRTRTRFRSTTQSHNRTPLAAEKQIRRQTFPLCSTTHLNCLICGVGEKAGAIALPWNAVIGRVLPQIIALSQLVAFCGKAP
jgi:hypothetical protein